MQVIIKKPQEKAEVTEIKNEYEELTKIVGGFIECVDIGKGVDMVCNEEGKLKGMAANLNFPYDVIVGTVFFCSSKEGDFISLNDKQIKFVKDMIKQREIL